MEASLATDFSLSPEKTPVAYVAVQGDDAGAEVELCVAPVDGSTPPVAVTSLGGAYRGPRGVGEGAFLTWGVSAARFDAGTGNAVAVIGLDGGTARSAASAPAGSRTVRGRRSCTAGRFDVGADGAHR
jgi:hypothetical protein